MAKKVYSINAPQTNFPMKANSPIRELEIQSMWESQKIYERSLQKNKNGSKFVLHDGPPYLSSNRIHIGTALNKILKDIIVKYRALQGFYAPFVPGYDSHGLPIETAVLKDVKGGRAALTPAELRKRCREFALANLQGQEADFKRLGIWGDWAHPYITMDKRFESAQLKVFGKMAEAGLIYKGLKTVQWCPNCQTALADAEVEYADRVSDSIYVRFALDAESRPRLPGFIQDPDDIYFVIWTTTPWTLPANLAIALNAQFQYEFIRTPSYGTLVMAQKLKESCLSALSIPLAEVTTIGTIPGRELEHITARHPFFDRASLVVLSEHVTSEAGTGCVHTAPGHGVEDFEIGIRYKLGVLSPVDVSGIYTEGAGPFAGLQYDKAIDSIIELLKEKGTLLHNSKLTHSYPHCWRCRKSLIFRATEQWFASVESFRKRALAAIDMVKWLPPSGKTRIYNMVANRSDWCISRQRVWGVPIPVFYCNSCKTPLMSTVSIEQVASVFETEGSDSWWEKDASYFIRDCRCSHCGQDEFTKETDIMDVWFDAGSTHAAVLDQRPELRGSPCEMYLEGSDQHRGWFQSSLLTSVATKGIAPYRTVLTHGYVVDESGRKLSKSLGNAPGPNDVIKEYGADVLRLWVASVNYTDDIPIGNITLAQLAEVYRKLRNTARYLLGNLYDFNPAADQVPFEQLKDLDKFILHRLYEVVGDIVADFDRYEFFKCYQALQTFCVVDLSSFYFDIVKDRLYTAASKSLERRAAQTVLEEVLCVIVRILAPITPHLAEDIWTYIPSIVKRSWKAEESVLLTNFPKPKRDRLNERRAIFWNDLIKLRSTVNKALEQARISQKIGSSLEAQVIIKTNDKSLCEKALSLGDDLSSFLITSQAKIDKSESLNDSLTTARLAEVSEGGISVAVLLAEGKKCLRCWKFSRTVGENEKHPELCGYCLATIIQPTE